MKMKKGAPALIRDYMRSQTEFRISTIAKLVRHFGIVPTYEQLVIAECKRTAHRLIASCIDRHGEREIVAGKQYGWDTEYVNIEKTKDMVSLDAAVRNRQKLKGGMTRTQKKIIWRLLRLDDCISPLKYCWGCITRSYLRLPDELLDYDEAA